MEVKKDNLLHRLSFLLSFHYSNRERKVILEDYRELFSVGAVSAVADKNASELLRAEQREYRSEAGWLHVMGGNVFLWETAYFAVLLVALQGLDRLGFFVAVPVCVLFYLAALVLTRFVTENYFDQSGQHHRNKGWFLPAVISLVYGLFFYSYIVLKIPGIYFGIGAKLLTYVLLLGTILCFFYGTYMQREDYMETAILFLYFILLTRMVLLNLYLMDDATDTYLRSVLLFLVSGVSCTVLGYWDSI